MKTDASRFLGLGIPRSSNGHKKSSPPQGQKNVRWGSEPRALNYTQNQGFVNPPNHLMF
jgi:hypothetical protein